MFIENSVDLDVVSDCAFSLKRWPISGALDENESIARREMF